ncbi:unnamed protein product [Phyllotreta striolata]|uniref:RING-type domain-containing protein n=1 Tax=Phyllotreta striolata TaxID=444603 RepID=A0A9N9XPG0_PHYSR|nr:unnamed protein product [Phyllotreta striolata]
MDNLSLLWQEAENIQKMLPWIDDIIDIIHYMSKIPSEFCNIRVPISLDYFLKLRDKGEDNLKTNIENDARDIENLLPDTDHNALITKLQSLGNVPNRKEVAIRQLLKDRKDLPTIQNALSKKVSENSNKISEPSESKLIEKSESNLNEMSKSIELNLNEMSESIEPNSNEISQSNEHNFNEMFESIETNLNEISERITSNLNEISKPIEHNSNEMSDSMETNLNEMSECIASHLNEVSEPIEHNSNEMSDSIETNLNEMSERIASHLNEISEPIEHNFNEMSEPIKTNSNEIDEPIDFSLNDISEFVNTKVQEISKSSDPDMDEIADPSAPNLIEKPFSVYQNISQVSDFQRTFSTNMLEINLLSKPAIAKSRAVSDAPEHSFDSQDITTAELLNLDLPATSVPNFANTEDIPTTAINLSFEDACRRTISSLTRHAGSSNTNSTQYDMQNPPMNQQSSNNAPAGDYHTEFMTHTATVTSEHAPATTAYGGIVSDQSRCRICPPILGAYNEFVYGNPQVQPEIRVRPNSELLMARSLSDDARLRRYNLLNNSTITSSSALNSNSGRETMKRPHSAENNDGAAQDAASRHNPFLDGIGFDQFQIPGYLLQNDKASEPPRRRIAVQKAKLYWENDAVELVPSTSTSNSNIRIREVDDVKPSLTNPESVHKEMLVEEISDDSIPDDAVLDDKLVRKLMEVFPDACSDYIKRISKGKTVGQLNELINGLLENEYPKRSASPPKKFDPDEQFEFVKALLPDADPTYLRLRCEGIGNDPDALNAFINNARELKNYPTMKEYLQKQKFSAQCKQYTTEFAVEHFVEVFPDPEGSFKDANRKCVIDEYAKSYISKFFRNRHCKLSVVAIQSVLRKNNYRIMASEEVLREVAPDLKRTRAQQMLVDPPLNVAVLQEIAYLAHKEEIETYMKELKEKREAERREAKENGLFQTCQCCYDDEVMPNELFTCPKGCEFCGSCIKKSSEITLGKGEINVKCLNDCIEEFSIAVLQKVLPPKMFSVLAQKKAVAEVKAAGIEDLETCPFCDFASIPNGADRIFRCLNPDCMKESCRSCKNENHIPYRCDEVEKDDEVKARVFIENQMTEALVRTCWRCKRKFFKEEGCNKMTCTCGAKMCYICREPLTNYSHFNGIGGDKHHLCPLYSDNLKLNHESVVEAAATAKTKVDASKLKVDPTADLEEHYKKRAKKLPVEPHVHVLNRFQGGIPRPQIRFQGVVPRQPHRGRGRRTNNIH